MKNFGIVDKGIVTNVVVAESIDVLGIFYPDSEIVEVTKATGAPFIEGLYADGKFTPNKEQQKELDRLLAEQALQLEQELAERRALGLDKEITE